MFKPLNLTGNHPLHTVQYLGNIISKTSQLNLGHFKIFAVVSNAFIASLKPSSKVVHDRIGNWPRKGLLADCHKPTNLNQTKQT